MDTRVEDSVISTEAKPASGVSRWRRFFTLSPINRRRWRNFKANKRGYWSLRIFLALFAVTLFAEFISNDRPIVAYYKGEVLFPVLVDYPESKFGGFLAVTDYKDKLILEEIKEHGWAVWPPIGYSYNSINFDYPRIKNTAGQCLGFPGPPSWATQAKLCEAPQDQLDRYHALGNRNWLGTDDQGRDVLARLIYGFRISVLFGLLLTVFSSIIGVTAGAVQGYFGGRVDLIFQRFLEIWSSIPSLFVLIIISSVLIPGFWTLLIVLLLFHWVYLVGVVRAEFLRGRNLEYITAARALGLSDTRIMFKHLLVPTDGSPLSEAAMHMAVGLARQDGARITSLYMIRPFHMTVYSAEMVGSDQDEFQAVDRQRAQIYLDTIRSIATQAGVECDTDAPTGSHPYEAILETAKKRHCDLIVMASHGHGGIRGLLLGSETQKVLTHSHLPILVVRPPV